MRSVIKVAPGEVELNYMWLPTWIGINNQFKERLEKELASKIEGRPLNDTTLDDVNDMVLDFIDKEFSLTGLRDYLDGLKFVEDK
jgi:hypothetical protein